MLQLQREITDRLLEWYGKHRRSLPWRDISDPYGIWISEVMLQQTRVDTVIPYFQRWLARFPTIADLAAADLQEVLQRWEGLGYYSRARNLHQAARLICQNHEGQLPRSPEALLKLPGIGRYTAGAIASIAFQIDAPTLDGNIRRILSRLFAVREPLGTAASDRRLWQKAGELVPSGRAGDFNQALMDLGAAVCLPRQPACDRCPLAICCETHRLQLQNSIPVMKAKRAVPDRYAIAAIAIWEDRVLLYQNRDRNLLKGLWEFPSFAVERQKEVEMQKEMEMDKAAIAAEMLQRSLWETFGIRIAGEESLGSFRHTYTHFRMTLDAYACRCLQIGDRDLSWVAIAELPTYPMGKLARQVSNCITSRFAIGSGAEIKPNYLLRASRSEALNK